MNLRHAAALALVGWYLMTPPLYKEGANWNAPLSDWSISKSFDSAADCEQARQQLVDQGFKFNNAKTATIDQRQAGAVFMGANCVASDDPRLKEK